MSCTIFIILNLKWYYYLFVAESERISMER